MKTYRITHRIDGDRITIEAESAHEACAKMDWMIGHCHVEELEPITPWCPECRGLVRIDADGRCVRCGKWLVKGD